MDVAGLAAGLPLIVAAAVPEHTVRIKHFEAERRAIAEAEAAELAGGSSDEEAQADHGAGEEA